jgi:tetratricopeptide (TPR) repeat protein
MFQKSDREATKLLDYEAGHPYRDWEAKNSILVTWKISFEHIRSIRPSATDLLSLMSFFDRQGVSENLLRVYDKIQNNTSSSEETTFGYNDNDTDHNFEDDITTLRDFSFISINRDSTVFMMHRLVQLSVHVWLKANRQLERWKEQFIMALWQRFPTGKYENWAQCQSLFPHVKSAMSQKPESHDFLEKWATLLYNGAWYAREIGNIRESRDMASESRNQRLLIFGFDSEKTLGSSAMLGEAYRLEGQWGDAEQLEVQVMETSKTKLGADHPNTLTSMANLASTYRNQGRWEEAEQLVVQVMETRKTKFGADHPDTLTSMNNLAHTLRSSGQYTAALRLMADCVQLLDRKLGPDHPHTISSKSALNEWRGKVDSLSSQLTKPPTDTKEASILRNSTETSEQVSRPGGRRKRTTIFRLFGRK